MSEWNKLIPKPNSTFLRVKCPKCGNVFDASCSISLLHFGTLKQMKCPACGKISLMNTHVKNPITWPPEEKNQHQQQAERQLTQEEVENKRIEESKYEKA